MDTLTAVARHIAAKLIEMEHTGAYTITECTPVDGMTKVVLQDSEGNEVTASFYEEHDWSALIGRQLRVVWELSDVASTEPAAHRLDQIEERVRSLELQREADENYALEQSELD